MHHSHPSPARYAVLRVDKRKAKALGAIAAASAHQLRQRPTPNADASGPAPIIMHLAAGATPYQAASTMLDGAERRNCTTVLAREIVLSASPGYFRPGREHQGGEFLPERVKAWATAALEWAKRIWPDQLASFVVHLDEQTPHAHLLCVPRERKADGGWRLNSKKFFDREKLRDLQSSYGEAMAPLGLKRGEPSSTARHTEVRQFYGALGRAKNGIHREAPPPAPKRPSAPQSVFQRSLNPLLDAMGIESERSLQLRRYEEERRKWLAKMKQHRMKEEERWQEMAASVAAKPVLQRSQPPERSERQVRPVKPAMPTIRRPRLG
jgi:hypothetical protein